MLFLKKKESVLEDLESFIPLQSQKMLKIRNACQMHGKEKES